jgi:cyclopropane-fatty-acyl-phospholipid synthase
VRFAKFTPRACLYRTEMTTSLIVLKHDLAAYKQKKYHTSMLPTLRRFPTVIRTVVPFIIRASVSSTVPQYTTSSTAQTWKENDSTAVVQKVEKVKTSSWGSERLANNILSRLNVGTLNVTYPDGTTRSFGKGGIKADITLNDLRVMNAVMRYGDIGFAEAYINGDWTSSNLTALLDLLVQNRSHIETAIYGSWLGRVIYRMRHLMNRNSKEGSKKNIHAHYDIGNEFYKLWLDSSMTYSSAIFGDENTRSLYDAQIAKYKRVIDEINVKPGDRVLEIGCGWGGFAETIIRDKQVHLTGVTLSTEQLQWANRRMAQHGMSQNVDLRLQDYRDIQGQFDAIASIEMFEAVGEQYWSSFFDCVSKHLKQGGRACIQTITIRDDLFPQYRVGTDFIQQYIFPGGMMASPSAFKEQCDKAGLKIVNEYKFGLDYARTLKLWNEKFQEQKKQVMKCGLDEKFMRTWEFYLSYCEAGFNNNNIDVVQYTLIKDE